MTFKLPEAVLKASALPALFTVHMDGIEDSEFRVSEFHFSKDRIYLAYSATTDGMPNFKAVDKLHVTHYKSDGEIIETQSFRVLYEGLAYSLGWEMKDKPLTYNVEYVVIG